MKLARTFPEVSRKLSILFYSREREIVKNLKKKKIELYPHPREQNAQGKDDNMCTKQLENWHVLVRGKGEELPYVNRGKKSKKKMAIHGKLLLRIIKNISKTGFK